MRSNSGGRLFSSLTTQSFKSNGASNNVRTFVTAAREFMAAPSSSMSMTAKQFQPQMSSTVGQVFNSSNKIFYDSFNNFFIEKNYKKRQFFLY